jgi:hypothetical protein
MGKISPPMVPPLCHSGAYRILRAMPAVALLLVGPPMPDRSRVIGQTKRGTLALQVGVWA